MTEATKKTLNRHYGTTAEELRAKNAARTGTDTWRDTRITRPYTPEEMAEKARVAELQRQKEAEQAAQEQAVADLAAFHDEKMAAWERVGGTKKDFANAWPQIREQYLLKKIGV